MERDDFWISHIHDNRIRGLLGELSEAIEECEDADTLNRLRSSLGKGFTNFASSRERELRALNGCANALLARTAVANETPFTRQFKEDAKALLERLQARA